ncbi:MAG: hypothetical protein NXI19_03950 [Alphaproteobacteria bacterium]|nr:hypothetical protein [Alphaproteobacteria bacterium]
MLRSARKSKLRPSLAALCFLLAIVGTSIVGFGGSARASDERVDHPESYYLAVLGLCYRAGAGMFGEAVVETAGLSVPSPIRREVLTDWERAARAGAGSVTAFCAHSYYAAIGKGYLRSR